jgi:hypothetical protein
MEGKSCDSKHRHQVFCGILRVDTKKLLKIWEIFITELCGRDNLSVNLEVENEQKVY